MSDETTNAPVVANLQTGAVTADTDAPLNKPSRRTVSLVWVGIVFGNLAVMILAAAGLTTALFMPSAPSLVEPSLLLVLFTTPSAFLAGLIARDPGQHG